MEIAKLREGAVYCILDLDLPYIKRNPLDIVKELIKGGADIIQLRTKKEDAKNIISLGKRIKLMCLSKGLTFIINDRADIAFACDADGLHLGQNDLPIEFARKILGEDKIIGLSTHNLSQARDAHNKGADYISIGPIFRSPTKPNLKAIGLRELKKIVDNVNLPTVAIGGINLSNIKEVLATGVKSVALISAILKSEKLCQTTLNFKLRIK